MGFQDDFSGERAARRGKAIPSRSCESEKVPTYRSRAGETPDDRTAPRQVHLHLDPRLRGDDNGLVEDDNAVIGDDAALVGDAAASAGDDDALVRTEIEAVHPEPVEGPPAADRSTSTSSARTEILQASAALPSSKTRHDGWTPDVRVKFLQALARTGNVRAAAHYVQRSRETAYALRRRDADFARAWNAALLIARDNAQDILQERAIEGVEEKIYYHGEEIATRRRYDSRLLLAHLARLDKLAERATVQRGAARFDDMLAAIAAEEDTAPMIAEPTADENADALAEDIAAQQMQTMRAAALADAAKPSPFDRPDDELASVYEASGAGIGAEPEHWTITQAEAATLRAEVPGLCLRSLEGDRGDGNDDMIAELIQRAMGKPERGDMENNL